MLLRIFALTGLIVFFIPCVSAIAQSTDPFGTPAAKEKAQADAGGDPFGGDPFGGPNDAQPVKPPAANEKQSAPSARPKSNATPASTEEAEARIRSVLSDETANTFVETPLEEAARSISRTHNIPVIIDSRALEEIGLSPDVPVNIDLTHVTLRSFLRLMLRELDLTYVISHEVLIITTEEAAIQYMTLETYSFYEGLSNQSSEIVKALTVSVAPDAWTTNGGKCSVSVVENVLFVLAHGSIHDGVADFMQKLDAAFAERYAPKE
ncbi:MAG: DUF4974 domain-containing protein [Pirellulaceae bacterium]